MHIGVPNVSEAFIYVLPALVSNERQSGKEKYFTVNGRDWSFPFMEIVMKVILVSMCEKSLGVLL